MKAYETPNYRQIRVTFLGATDTLGSRIKIYEPKRYNGDKVQSKVFSYDYSIGNVEEQAYKILVDNGFKVVARCSDIGNYILLCNNWGGEFINIKDLK